MGIVMWLESLTWLNIVTDRRKRVSLSFGNISPKVGFDALVSLQNTTAHQNKAIPNISPLTSLRVFCACVILTISGSGMVPEYHDFPSS